MRVPISKAVSSATPQLALSLHLHRYTGAHQHTSQYRWEDEAGHYDSGGNDMGTRRQRRKGQVAQVGACDGRASRAVLLHGLRISGT
uniref:Uncharacterized protein n=1 Tax=Romanomermis culicivorax TaxID=13658 RepID=A0A915HQN3_ROMCU